MRDTFERLVDEHYDPTDHETITAQKQADHDEEADNRHKGES